MERQIFFKIPSGIRSHDYQIRSEHYNPLCYADRWQFEGKKLFIKLHSKNSTPQHGDVTHHLKAVHSVTNTICIFTQCSLSYEKQSSQVFLYLPLFRNRK